MADLNFTITFDSNGEPVLKGITRESDKMGRGAKAAADKASGGFRRWQASIVAVNQGLQLVGSVVRVVGRVGATITRGISGIVEAGSTVETLKTRLIAMSGSAEEAEKKFETLVKISTSTPFELKNVVEAGITLEAFGASSLKTIKPVADLAAFMGLDIPLAAQAFGRAFAAGAGAADILRDRGILSIIELRAGIEDLSKLTLPQFRKILLETLVTPAGRIAGSTDLLAKTWRGVVSNMRGEWFTLLDALSQAGILDGLKGIVNKITGEVIAWTKAVKENKDVIAGWATSILSAAKSTANGVIDALTGMVLFMSTSLPKAINAVGASIKAVSILINGFKVGVGLLTEGAAFVASPFAKATDALGLTEGAFKNVQLAAEFAFVEGIGPAVETINKQIKDLANPTISKTLQGEIESAAEKFKSFGDKAKGSIAEVRDEINAPAKVAEQLTQEFGRITDASGNILGQFGKVPQEIKNAVGQTGNLNKELDRTIGIIDTIGANPLVIEADGTPAKNEIKTVENAVDNLRRKAAQPISVGGGGSGVSGGGASGFIGGPVNRFGTTEEAFNQFQRAKRGQLVQDSTSTIKFLGAASPAIPLTQMIQERIPSLMRGLQSTIKGIELAPPVNFSQFIGNQNSFLSSAESTINEIFHLQGNIRALTGSAGGFLNLGIADIAGRQVKALKKTFSAQALAAGIALPDDIFRLITRSGGPFSVGQFPDIFASTSLAIDKIRSGSTPLGGFTPAGGGGFQGGGGGGGVTEVNMTVNLQGAHIGGQELLDELIDTIDTTIAKATGKSIALAVLN